MAKRDSSKGTYVITKTGAGREKRGAGKQVIVSIVTPAGTFRTISKDVLDRAKRATNSALKSGGTPCVPGEAGKDAQQR